MSAPATVVILSGGGNPAVRAANLYFDRLGSAYRVLLVEERTLSAAKIWTTLRRRWHQGGLAAVLDLLALRLWFMLRPSAAASRHYVPTLYCDDINDPEVAALLRRERPAWVITNACSIVREPIFAAVDAPMLNVHNGITPRYRGTGNFWALREDNPALFGVTVHRTERGIDTGERLAVQAMDINDPRCATLAGVDEAAFEEGALLVCAHILAGEGGVPSRFRVLSDRYYSYPGLRDWLAARRVLRRWRVAPQASEAVWRASFEDYAHDQDKDVYQRMHWGHSDTVAVRDAVVLALLNAELAPAARLLDLGGGDGRMALGLPQLGAYCCVDYTHAFLTGLPTGTRYPAWAVQCDARALPLGARSFDAAIAVGLFQHLAEAQQVADQLRRVVRPDGLLVINTLRQFSRLELVVILAASWFSPARWHLAVAITRRDYFRGTSIDGTLVARRYARAELMRMFGVEAKDCMAHYDGLFGSRCFAREITLVMRARP